LRVGKVISAEEVSGTDKLLKLEVTLGEEKRTIVAGVKKYYSAEEILGKKIIIVTNLQPVKVRGIESQGMLLAAVNKDSVVLLTIDKYITEGSKIQ
jgi:methionyl-tRNA synthetase